MALAKYGALRASRPKSAVVMFSMVIVEVIDVVLDLVHLLLVLFLPPPCPPPPPLVPSRYLHGRGCCGCGRRGRGSPGRGLAGSHDRDGDPFKCNVAYKSCVPQKGEHDKLFFSCGCKIAAIDSNLSLA